MSFATVSFPSRQVLACLGLAICMPLIPRPTLALEDSRTVKVTQLLKASTSWDGQPLAYPKGPAEVSAMLVELAPGAETGWHLHPVPSFAMLLEGELEIALKDGRKKRLGAGEAVAEVVGAWHNGRNPGSTPLKLVVFYAGVEGTSLTTSVIPTRKEGGHKN